MQIDPLFLSTVTDNAPNLTFVRANARLINCHSTIFNKLQTDSKRDDLLETLWVTEYNAQLVKDSKRYTGIKFKDKQSLSMFLLRWS